MKKWNGYETTQIMGNGKKKLPVGAYACKVLEAREESYGWGSVLVIHFDIAEGEYKNFYREQYEIDGNSGFFTTMRYTCEVDRLDKVQLPKPLMLKKDGTSNSNTSNDNTWEDTEGLPF